MFRRVVIAVTTCVMVAVGLLFAVHGPSTAAAQEAPQDSGPVWLTVSAGGFHTCGIRTDHTLWCWGDNGYGQLGLGDKKKRAMPTQVGTGTDWAGLVAGNAHTCATRTDHTLWCWGLNRDGQLGIGSNNLEAHHSDPGRHRSRLGRRQRCRFRSHLRDPHRSHAVVLGIQRQPVNSGSATTRTAAPRPRSAPAPIGRT